MCDRFTQWANDGNQRLATMGLSTPLDLIASPLHCFVRLRFFQVDAIAVTTGRGNNEENQVARVFIDELMRHPGRNGTSLLSRKRKTLAIHFQRRAAGQHEEELVGLLMVVTHFATPGRHALLDDTESR